MKNKTLTIILISLIWLACFSEAHAENQTEIDKAVNYLVSQSSDPWITIALIASGKTDSDLNYLKTISGSSATDYEKIILAITAANENPKTFGNVDFVARLKGFYQNNQIGSSDYLNDDFWGILALVSAGEGPSSQIIQDSKNFILANQNSDGGFPFGSGWGSDIDDTAAAIMALLESGVSSSDPAITKAVDYLKANQNNDGGFPYDPVSPWGTDSDASSDAWVISAVIRFGEDPDGPSWSKNGLSPVDHLLSLQADDGYFEYQEGTGEDSFSSMTTSYAVVALSQKFYPINKWSALPSSNENSGARTYGINASAGEHGLIFLSGMVRASVGSDEAFIITPDTGYHILDVLVDDASVGAINSYTFANINADHTITVSFAIDDVEVIAENDGYTPDATINQSQPDLESIEPDQNEESDQTQQDVEQEEQIAAPQQEETASVPIVTQASLLTGITNFLFSMVENAWLIIISIIFVFFISTVFYLYRKEKIKKNIIYIIVGIGVIVFIGSWLYFSNGFWQASVEENNVLQGVGEEELVLVIDDGEGDPNIIAAEFKEGMTAFDLLKDKTDELNITLKTKTYDAGILIEAIGDRKNGQDGKYWLYYVNGEMPMVSADKIILKIGDKVEFKFEKSSF